jgi:hypothetical protein
MYHGNARCNSENKFNVTLVMKHHCTTQIFVYVSISKMIRNIIDHLQGHIFEVSEGTKLN